MLYRKEYDTSYEEIISHYPMFYRDVLEMRAILEAEGKALDGAIGKVNQLLDNAFLSTADEDTIARMEVFLGITPDDNATIEERRKAIWLYYTGFGKMSASKLKAILFPYTGEECTITFAPADVALNNLLRIVLPRGSTQRLSELDVMNILARRLPSHLWYGVEVVYSEQAPVRIGVATTYISEIDIDSVEEDVTAIIYLADELEVVLIDELGNILSE